MSGSWENNGTFTPGASTVLFNATTTNFARGIWFDDAWQYRVPITISASNVSSDLTDFPVYVDLSTLPSSFFSQVQTDGDDIRVTTADEVSEVPFELVSIILVLKQESYRLQQFRHSGYCLLCVLQQSSCNRLRCD